LSGFLEQLKDEKSLLSESAQLALISAALRCNKSISSLIRNLLDFSLLEAGKMSLKPEVFDLVENIRFLEQLLRPRANEKEIALNWSFNFSEKEENLLYGDWLRLEQITVNLVTNAIKFTPQHGTVNFTLSISKRNNEGIYLDIVVSDNGIGIGKEFQSKLFQPFFQVERNSHNGSGLGLFIVSEIVKAMNGEITFKSEKGTTFFVRNLFFPFSTIQHNQMDEQFNKWIQEHAAKVSTFTLT
jgi:two-component system sensor histidine kinase/response regulator